MEMDSLGYSLLVSSKEVAWRFKDLIYSPWRKEIWDCSQHWLFSVCLKGMVLWKQFMDWAIL